MYKPDWFDSAKTQRANETNVDDVSTWCAKLGLGMGGGGELCSQEPFSWSLSKLTRSSGNSSVPRSNLAPNAHHPTDPSTSASRDSSVVPWFVSFSLPPSLSLSPRTNSPLDRSSSASLPSLSILPFNPPSLTRSMQNILSLTDAPEVDDEERVEEADQDVSRLFFFTEREEEEVGEGEESEGEVEGDGVEEF